MVSSISVRMSSQCMKEFTKVLHIDHDTWGLHIVFPF